MASHKNEHSEPHVTMIVTIVSAVLMVSVLFAILIKRRKFSAMQYSLNEMIIHTKILHIIDFINAIQFIQEGKKN